MKQLATILCLVCLFQPLQAQKNHFSLVVGGGPNYFFINGGVNSPVNRSLFCGVNYQLSSKNQVVIFNPGIYFQSNRYRSRANEYTYVHVMQRGLSLHLDMMLRLSRSIYMRGGILFNSISASSQEVIMLNKPGSHYYAFSNNAIQEPYSGNNLQAGINMGFCFAFSLFGRSQIFGLQFNHIVSPLVNHDYTLEKAVAGADVSVLTTATRASMLLLSLGLSLAKKKKKKKEEEE